MDVTLDPQDFEANGGKWIRMYHHMKPHHTIAN